MQTVKKGSAFETTVLKLWSRFGHHFHFLQSCFEGTPFYSLAVFV